MKNEKQQTLPGAENSARSSQFLADDCAGLQIKEIVKTQLATIPLDYLLVTDSQDVAHIKSEIGPKANEFDSFFVQITDGEYTGAYGFYGIVPLLNKAAVKLI